MQNIEKSYDEVPYNSKVFKYSMPENSALAAIIFGLKTPKIENARVLELACSMGGNIIPFALNHPNASVVGVDLSSKQIAKAKEISKKLELKNIKFEVKNIKDIDKSFGEFDYIIAHGVYSWVSDDIKDAILRIFSECLSENGVAYLSYNCYPGWKGKEILRDITLFRNEGKEISADESILNFKDTLKYLKNNATGMVKNVVDNNFDNIINKRKDYLIHEYMEGFNQPNYLYEVVRDAKNKGLEYLCEANFKNDIFLPINDSLKDALEKECGKNRVKIQQFIDFITNRTFRRTLFIKDDFAKNMSSEANLKFETIDELFLSGKFSYDFAKQSYKNLENNMFMPRGMGELLESLNEIYPSNLKIGDFMSDFKKVHNKEEISAMYKNIGYSIFANLIEANLCKMKFLAPNLEKPKIKDSHIKLLEILKKDENTISFFTPKYDNIGLNKEIDYEILPKFNGKNSKNDLVKELINFEKNGKFHFVIEEKIVKNEKKIEQMAEKYINDKINMLSACGLLV